MELEKLIERMQTDCKIRGDGHRRQFTMYRKLHVIIGLPSALLATAAGSVATISASSADASGANLTLFEGIGLSLSWIVALLTAAHTFLRPHETSQGHREKASTYDVLLGRIDRALAFAAPDEKQTQLEEIDMKIEELKLSEPILSDTQINKARENLKNRELTFRDTHTVHTSEHRVTPISGARHAPE